MSYSSGLSILVTHLGGLNSGSFPHLTTVSVESASLRTGLRRATSRLGNCQSKEIRHN